MHFPLESRNSTSADIVIIGAGLAGVTAASILGRNWRVILVDPRASCPPVFKSEKIEPGQAAMLRKFGLLETLLPRAPRIREIQSYYRGRFFKITPTEQYGLHYSVMVNTLREALPGGVQFKLGRAVNVLPSSGTPCVMLDSGEHLSCRLVVLACGLNRELLGSLNLNRVWIQKKQSIAVGFSLTRPSGEPFAFDALTYTVRSSQTGIDYVSLFPIEHTLRANLFAFPAPDNSWLLRLHRDSARELPEMIPKLARAIGEYGVASKVESSIIDLYKTEGDPAAGVVLIGDACGNVCPSTGLGLTKIFTDVDVLSDWVPRWFQTEGIGPEKIGKFFRDERKTSADAKALRSAFYRRNACSARSLKWKIHRTKLRLSVEIAAQRTSPQGLKP